ncbi:MAG: DUF2330 domain-containing protein [Deltaproteobacteria bacterium]|nr:DUF2330 domain-containing protein [Deltaproteobacteria bacterium]
MTGHRMVLSLSATHTTLWDQLRYTGDPEDFLWVLPIPASAIPSVGLGDNAFMDAVDELSAPRIVVEGSQLCPLPGAPGSTSQADSGASTGTWVSSSEGGGGGGGAGCGYSPPRSLDYVPGGRGSGNGSSLPSERSGPTTRRETYRGSEGVGVPSRGSATVGPYAVHVVGGGTERRFEGWVAENGYVIPGEVRAAVEFYSELGFAFLVLRLRPGAGVHQMQPVRVRFEGASPHLPLRMIAAGVADRVDLTLLVFATGSVRAGNFPTAMISDADLTFNLRTQRSNYLDLYDQRRFAHGGNVWILESADTALASSMALSPSAPPASPRGPSAAEVLVGETSPWMAGTMPASTVWRPYRPDGLQIPLRESGALPSPLLRMNPTVDPHVDRMLAFEGLGGRAVLSRLRASLPRMRLDRDLRLEDADGVRVPQVRYVANVTGLPPCPTASRPDRSRGIALASVAGAAPRGPGLVLAAALALLARRSRRRGEGGHGNG